MLQMNTPTTTAKASDYEHSLIDNAVAISAHVHGSSGYATFYMRIGRAVSGFPGIWRLCINAAEEFTKQELRILAEDKVDGVYSFEWLEAIDEYAGAILQLKKEELDRLNLERVAHQIVWGRYRNQCPGFCLLCRPT